MQIDIPNDLESLVGQEFAAGRFATLEEVVVHSNCLPKEVRRWLISCLPGKAFDQRQVRCITNSMARDHPASLRQGLLVMSNVTGVPHGVLMNLAQYHIGPGFIDIWAPYQVAEAYLP